MEEKQLGTVICPICKILVHFFKDDCTAESALAGHIRRFANMDDPWARFYHGPHIARLREEMDQFTHA